MKRFLPTIFLFVLFTALFITPKPAFAAISCPSSVMFCSDLDSNGGCPSTCKRAVISNGSPGGRGAAVGATCQCQIPVTKKAGPGEECQGDENNNNCTPAAPYCWSAAGSPPICRTQTHSQAIQQNQTGSTDNPIPKPIVPCNKTADPEFNSLRPYQASPCGDSSYAMFCGNKINLVETNSWTIVGQCLTSYDPNWVQTDKPYWIDLSGTDFPILGNTELVKNSTSPTDTIDDATKVNEYVSWYLNGTNNHAENGSNDPSKIVDYAGPINKLLPQTIAEAQRITSIKATKTNTNNTIDDSNQGAPASGPETHNQIVVCTKTGPLPGPWWLSAILNFAGIGAKVPTDCYTSPNSKAQPDVYRLSDVDTKNYNWSGGSIAQEIINWALKNLTKLYPNGLVTNIIANMGVRWPLKIPPLPWSDENGKPFLDAISYQKAYNEWRGQLCAILPNFLTSGKSLVCIGAWPWINNPYADLFPYVPLASTPDKIGKMPTNTIDIVGAGGTHVADSKWTKLADPTLYYAHTQEAKDLSATLNETYVPNKLDTSSIPANSTEDNKSCKILNVRSNPGDNLFPIKTPGDIGDLVSFHVDNVPCECTTNSRGVPVSHCHGEVDIGIHTDPVNAPNANDIWKSTVAGNASTFRKIYPKVGPGAPVTCIADIPSVTGAVYTPVEGTNSITVTGPLGSPDQTTTDPNNAKIYFPHYGSVYDYFLKGIQTALRPQGYGEPTPQSGTDCETSTGNNSNSGTRSGSGSGRSGRGN